MNLKLFLIMFFCCFVFTLRSVEAGWFGPSNYDECILQYIKNSRNNYAITKIRKACHDKFYIPYVPKKKKKPVDPNKIDWDALEKKRVEYQLWSKKMCDCILENMKDVDNKRAAFLIYKSCADKTGEWLDP